MAEVTVRYWASAREAAGTGSEQVVAATLAEAVAQIRLRHGEDSRLAQVVDCCTVLKGDLPVGSLDRDAVLLRDGDTLEFLPPFAGG